LNIFGIFLCSLGYAVRWKGNIKSFHFKKSLLKAFIDGTPEYLELHLDGV
jgi:hypothetical protein